MRLTVASGPDRGLKIPLTDKLIVGRNPECDVVLKDLQVSRRHAYLKPLPDGRVELHDLESGNGTYVNGRRVQSAVLTGIETIRFGDTVMELSLDGAPDPGSAPPVAAGDPPYRERFGPSSSTSPAPPPPAPPPGPASKSSIQRRILQRSVRRATVLGGVACVLAVGVAILFVTGALTLQSEDGGSDGFTTPEIVEQVTPSTVLVVNDEGTGVVGRGSGWVLDADEGLIVTNAHVTATPRGEGTYSVGIDALIRLRPSRRGVIAGTEGRRAELVGQALCEDIAILEVGDTTGLRTLPMLDSQSELRVGDPVIAVGYPATKNVSGFSRADLTGNTGVVSVPRTTFRAVQAGAGIVAGPYRNVILTDTVINEGNSGGPLVTEEGNLAGMNSAGNDSVQGQNYAIGVDRLREMLPKIESGEDVCG